MCRLSFSFTNEMGMQGSTRVSEPALRINAQRARLHSFPVPCGSFRRTTQLQMMIRVLLIVAVIGGLDRSVAAQQIDLPEASIDVPVTMAALDASQWKEGAYDVWHLRGGVVITQGELQSRSDEAICWVEHGDPYFKKPARVIVYVEGGVRVQFGASGAAADGSSSNVYRAPSWLGRFQTRLAVEMNVVASGGRPDPLPSILARAKKAQQAEIDREVVPAQFPTQNLPPAAPNTGVLPDPGAGLGAPQAGPSSTPPPAIEFSGRNGGRPSLRSFQSPNSNEQVWIFDQGMKVVLRSDEFQQLPGTLGQTQQVVLMADRAVAWTNSLSELMQGGSQLDGKRWEFYLEGNIVFTTGDRVVYADRMYYDANLKRGTILNAEIISPVDGFEGLLRVKAEIIEQLDERSIRAVNAAVTSSRLGYPRYWVQSENVNITHTQTPSIDPFTGQQMYDPVSGMPVNRNEYLATSRNNFVYLAGLPVFYWPTLKTDLAEPSVYLRSAGVRSDSVFGNQILSKWDAYNLLGLRDRPEGTDWTLDLDYLSDRGFAMGTRYEFENRDPFGIPGPYKGFIDAWGINDKGLDNLGLGRRAVPHDNELRGRVLSQYRHELDIGWQLTTEVGYVSDRNFLEQYYEREWDQQKDATTGLELLRNRDNRSLSLWVDARVNDFWMQTESLPRLDHYVLGQPIFMDALNWSAHTYGGYMHLNPAVAPTNPVDIQTWTPLPGEVDAEGGVFGTRHLVEAPVQLGPVRVVPYALGEGSYYYKDVNQEDITRFYGEAGLRMSLPFWKVDPTVCSLLWNLNGLAHKVSFDTDFFYADASQNLELYPRYNSPDDNSQEEFRRRFFFTTFDQTLGGAIPPQFDDRGYLFRTGTQNYVTSPVPEIADDLMVGRFAVRQRWQTKRGAPGRQRIVDWITLDVGGSYFPEADRDNFGENFGMFDYQFRWNIGDRFSLLSDGYADLFTDGLKTISVGSIISRPENGRLYLGIRQIDGPIESQIITAAWSYRMSDTWMTTASGSYDLGETGNIGQTINFTRIGESFLVSFGVRADASRGNVGAIFSIQPRFLPKSKMGQFDGLYIPPPGSRGLE